MERRCFLLTALAGLGAPLTAEAQASGKFRIGYLSGNPRSDTQDGIDA